MDSFITHVKAQGLSRTCNEIKEEEASWKICNGLASLFSFGVQLRVELIVGASTLHRSTLTEAARVAGQEAGEGF